MDGWMINELIFEADEMRRLKRDGDLVLCHRKSNLDLWGAYDDRSSGGDGDVQFRLKQHGWIIRLVSHGGAGRTTTSKYFCTQ